VRRHPLRMLFLSLGLAALAACQGRCFGGAKPQQQGGPDLADPAEPSFAKEAVSYCRERSPVPRQAQVQLLIDASGSMNGFTASMPSLVTWVEHAISGLRGSSLNLAGLRTCQFNQRGGLFGCASSAALSQYAPASETNLHKAIRAALDADLTFIVTDGVAATGVGGDADCATGVDAACVARALSETIMPEHSGGEGESLLGRGPAEPGIWVLPLVTTYEGRFFSEEAISPQDFDPNTTIEQIRSQVEKETVVQDPRLGSDNRLNYFYRGPKALLLIIIARWEGLGRDAVWSLWDQARLRGVTQLKAMREFSTGVGSLPPVEVYPGFLNRIRFESLVPTDEPSEHSGTLDVAFMPGESRGSIRLDCPPASSGEGVYILKGAARWRRQQSAACVPIQQLPAYSLRLESLRGEADKKDIETIVRDYQKEVTEETIRLDLVCGTAPRRPCESQPVTARWNALRDYDRTAAGLAAGETSGSALASVLDTSTAQPSREPHRIYGLAATLQSFYELVGGGASRLALADLEICNGSAQSAP
jgi:hypothetical protein